MDNIMGFSWMPLFSGLFGVLIGSLISFPWLDTENGWLQNIN